MKLFYTDILLYHIFWCHETPIYFMIFHVIFTINIDFRKIVSMIEYKLLVRIYT